MESVIRAAVVYLLLLVLFRIAGRRSLAHITTFDLVLVLVIGEATNHLLLGEDYSFTNAFLVIGVLIGLDIVFSHIKQRSRAFDRLVDGMPMILVENGSPLAERMQRARVGEDDVLSAARELQGLERMDEIKYAVLENDGHITIIPKRKNG